MGILSYNGKVVTLYIGRYVVDWKQIAGSLVQDTYRFVLPYRYLAGFSQSTEFV